MKVIGIDPGSYTIKIVEAETSFRGFVLTEFHEIPLGSDPDLQGLPLEQVQANLVKQALENLHLEGSRIIWTLPQSEGAFRIIDFPFKERKKINQTLPFQLEDLTPYDPNEDIVYDYKIFPLDKSRSRVCCLYSPKGEIRTTLENLNNSGLDPQVLTFPISSYHSIMSKTDLFVPGEATGLIDIGHQSTKIYIFDGNIPQLVQISHHGGYDVTIEIAKTYNIDLPEAEKAKHENGFIIPPGSDSSKLTSEQKEFSLCIQAAMKHLVRDIRHVLIAFRAKNPANISNIYVTGGTSRIPGIAPFLSYELGVLVKPFDPLSEIGNNNLPKSKKTQAIGALAASSASAFAEPIQPLPVNVRKGEFARKGTSSGFNLTELSHAISYFLIFVLILNLSFLFIWYSRSARREMAENSLYKSLKTYQKVVSDSPLTPGRRKRMIKEPKRIIVSINQKLRKKRKTLKALKNQNKDIESALVNLSRGIPKETKVEVANIKMKEGVLDLEIMFFKADDKEALQSSLNGIESLALQDFDVEKTDESEWTAKAKFEVGN